MTDDEKIWMFYFGGIAAIRFHPKNLGTFTDTERTAEEIRYSAAVADELLIEHKQRWPK